MEHYSNKKFKIHRSLIFCLLLLSILLSGCNNIVKSVDQETVKVVNRSSAVSKMKQGRIIESKVQANNELSSWKKIEINREESFDQLEFVDNLHGWIASDSGKLYRTIDGGKSWELLDKSPAIQPKSYLTNLTFSNYLSGWITLNEQGKNWGDSTAKIFHTEDGGLKWTLQFSNEDISLSKLVFLNDLEGWTIGSKVVKKEILYSEFVILHTTDGGKNWINLSEKVSKFADYKQSNVYEIVDIFVKDSNKITVITNDNRLLETNDSGENWQFIGEINVGNKIPNIISLQKDDFSILAGVDSKEGIGSNFLTREDNASWTIKIIPKFFLKDAVYFSENQVFACGSMLSADYTDVNTNKRMGVVLYSSDNGNNWTVIYRNKNVEIINVIKILETGHLWVAGDKGFLANNLIDNIVKQVRSKS